MGYEVSITYDLPITYKGIKLYPVTVKDYLLFTAYSQCFLIDKNSIPDPKIIAMSELEYLYYLASKDVESMPYLICFDRILAMSLKDDKSFESLQESMKRYRYDKKKKPVFRIGEQLYNYKDYLEIKQIICQQNFVELPDENISKAVRDSLEQAKKYKEKISGTKPASLEDYIISLATVTGWTFDYIYSLPVRKFIRSIRRFDNYVHYKIYLSASMSGFVEFKDKSIIKHWLTDIDTDDKYGDVSIDLDEMENKVNTESAK